MAPSVGRRGEGWEVCSLPLVVRDPLLGWDGLVGEIWGSLARFGGDQYSFSLRLNDDVESVDADDAVDLEEGESWGKAIDEFGENSLPVVLNMLALAFDLEVAIDILSALSSLLPWREYEVCTRRGVASSLMRPGLL